jgi:hypothetical protein
VFRGSRTGGSSERSLLDLPLIIVSLPALPQVGYAIDHSWVGVAKFRRAASLLALAPRAGIAMNARIGGQ